MNYMWNTDILKSILLSILKYKMKISSDVDMDKRSDMMEPDNETNKYKIGIPNYIEDVLDGLVTPASEYDEYTTDLLDEDLINIDTGNEGYNWIMNIDLILMVVLNNKT